MKNLFNFLLFFIFNLITIPAMSQDSENPKNVYGKELQPCCYKPLTGYFRDGICRTNQQDVGTHVICAEVTDEFLQYSLSRGNNLIQPSPQYNFPGLKDGDKWCLCALRWKEALEAGVAPPVDLEATDIKALDYVDIEVLEEYSLDKKQIDLSKHLWQDRVVLLASDNSDNLNLKKQLDILSADPKGNHNRDIALYVVTNSSLDYDKLNKEYGFEDSFNFILIGKDGGEKLTSNQPVSLEKLYSTIDSMPMRQREMSEDI
jgi:hypothetical protein